MKSVIQYFYSNNPNGPQTPESSSNEPHPIPSSSEPRQIGSRKAEHHLYNEEKEEKPFTLGEIDKGHSNGPAKGSSRTSADFTGAREAEFPKGGPKIQELEKSLDWEEQEMPTKLTQKAEEIDSGFYYGTQTGETKEQHEEHRPILQMKNANENTNEEELSSEWPLKNSEGRQPQENNKESHLNSELRKSALDKEDYEQIRVKGLAKDKLLTLLKGLVYLVAGAVETVPRPLLRMEIDESIVSYCFSDQSIFEALKETDSLLFDGTIDFENIKGAIEQLNRYGEEVSEAESLNSHAQKIVGYLNCVMTTYYKMTEGETA